MLLPLLLLGACAGRRGWLFCLPLLFALPQSSYAFEFNDLWLRPDQQGQRLLEQQRPDQAARHFEDRQWKGIALFQAGDYDGAARLFAEGNSAADHYNRGNALARSGELEAAVDAYEQALELQPDLQPALSNKALIEQVLEQRKAEQPEQPKEENPQSDPNAQTDSSSAQSTEGQAQETPAQQPSDSNKDENNTREQSQHVAANGDDEETTRPPQRPTDSSLDAEQRQALEQWLRQIPDNPSELLRRKFWYEQQQHQEPHR